jgi:hypothetical protein
MWKWQPCNTIGHSRWSGTCHIKSLIWSNGVRIYPDISPLIYHTVTLNIEEFWCPIRHWTSFACKILQVLGFRTATHLDPSHSYWACIKNTRGTVFLLYLNNGMSYFNTSQLQNITFLKEWCPSLCKIHVKQRVLRIQNWIQTTKNCIMRTPKIKLWKWHFSVIKITKKQIICKLQLMIPDNAVTAALWNLEKSTSTCIAISFLPATENQTTHIERKDNQTE